MYWMPISKLVTFHLENVCLEITMFKKCIEISFVDK